MNQPGKIDDLFLGVVAGLPVKAKLADTSSVAILATETVHMVAHIVIVCKDEQTTWTQAAESRMWRGDLVSHADRMKRHLAQHFLPGTPPEEVEAIYEVNSDGAASRPTVHTHVIIGHKSLFGNDGKLRRRVDDARKPRRIIEWFLEKADIMSESATRTLNELFPMKEKTK